jgi:hypothetical protein
LRYIIEEYVQVIAIDEAQFFSDLHEFCTVAANEDNKKVIVAGLNGDFRREKFGQVQSPHTPVNIYLTSPLYQNNCTNIYHHLFFADFPVLLLRLLSGWMESCVG